MIVMVVASARKLRRILMHLRYSLTHSLTHSLTYSFTHLLTYFLTHLLTHSLTHPLNSAAKSSYIYFVEENSSKTKEQYPDLKHKEIFSKVAEKWNSISSEGRTQTYLLTH